MKKVRCLLLHLPFSTTGASGMKTPHKHLTQETRYHISVLRKAGKSQAEIARTVGYHPSTISRELRRNTGKRGYRPKQAQQLAEGRKRRGNQCISDFEWSYISHLLEQDLSPEQVHGRLSLYGMGKVASVERIYQFVYQDKEDGGTLHTHLRCQKQRRKRYGSGQQRRGQLANRRGIEQRPEIANQRHRIGDIEGDTMIGKNHKGALLTLVDRKSRITFIRPLPNKQAEGLAESNIQALRGFGAQSITYDNGKEFAAHEKVAKALNVETFFADPYASWQRGTNENTNGLIRQYFPKTMPLDKVTEAQAKAVEDKLNNRPRKVLGYLTPNEVLSGVTRVAFAS
jgi:transposase, IS30 family